MAYKLIFISVLLTLMLFENSYGQRSETFFRKDYHYLDAPKSFYKIHKTNENWMEAKKVCKLEGASLFYPENKNELDAVIELWTRIRKDFDWIYIGISSRFTKNTFTTTEGRSINDFQVQWAAGEPNNNTGFDDCTELSRSRKSIYDDICTKKLPFICKKTLASLDWNERCPGADSGYIYNATLDKCYKLHGTPSIWSDAYAVCYHEQSHLAIVDSQDEADFFTRLLEEHRCNWVTKSIPEQDGKVTESILECDPHNEVAWLGFQNIDGAGWTTVQDKPVIVLGEDRKDHWLRREDERGCGYIYKDGSLRYKWNCKEKRSFICEFDTKSLNNKCM